MRIVFLSDNPTLNTSFAIQASTIAEHLATKHDVHYVAMGMFNGNPFKYKGFTVHPGIKTRGGQQQIDFFNVVDKVDPHMVITHMDLHQTAFLLDKPRNFLWFANFPVDVEGESLDHAQFKMMLGPDVRVPETLIARQIMLNRGMRRSFWIPCFVDTDYYKPVDAKEMRERLGFTEDDFVVLFVGRPNWRKNFPTILATMNKLVNERGLDHVKLLLHTDIDDPAAQTNYRQWLHALDLNNNVVYTESVLWDEGIDKEQLNLLYNSADVYFQPHAGEGFGITMAEAMATGLPVIASDYTSSKEMIGNNERGTRIPCNSFYNMMGVKRPIPFTEDCANAIEEYMNDPEMREQRGLAAFEHALKHYDKTIVLAAWEAMLARFAYKRVGRGFNIA